MCTKYAIRITEENLDLIRILRPIVDINVRHFNNRYFLFTTTNSNLTTEHDVVEGSDLAIYDGDAPGKRIVIQ